MNRKERLEKLHSIYNNLSDNEITEEFKNTAKELIDMIDEDVKLMEANSCINPASVITNVYSKSNAGVVSLGNHCIICGGLCEIDTMVCRECKDVIKRAKESYHRNSVGL